MISSTATKVYASLLLLFGELTSFTALAYAPETRHLQEKKAHVQLGLSSVTLGVEGVSRTSKVHRSIFPTMAIVSRLEAPEMLVLSA